MRYCFLIVFMIFSVASAQENLPTTPSIQINVHLLEQSDSVNEPSLTVIGHDELEKHQGESAQDLLQDVTGLLVTSSGGEGQPTSVLMRGASSQETLVLIDGMEVNDPLNPSGGYDFSQLSLEALERVEIYRGPQSARFGNGAVGGVINFITKKGEGPASASALVEGGAYQTAQTMAQVSGRKNQFSYSFGARLFTTQGFSSADEREGATEKDGEHLSSVSSRVGWAFDADNEIEATVRSTQSKMDLDRSGGPNGDDPNYAGEMNQLASNVKYHRLSFDGKLDSLFMLSWAEFKRSDRNDPDAASTVFSWDNFLSEARKLEFDNEYYWSEKESVRFGLQLADESGGSTTFASGTVTDFSRQYQSVSGASLIFASKSRPYFYEIGAREDHVSIGESVFTYSLMQGYELPTQTTFRWQLSSGFKTPSLYQLYSSYGDPSLEVEKVKSWEISLEQNFLQSSALSLTYFENRFDDLIDFSPTLSKYENIGEASTRGFELEAKTSFAGKYFLIIGENYLLTKDQSTGRQLLRRPQNSLHAEALYREKRWEADLRYRLVGGRADLDPVSFARVDMPSYQVADLQASCQLNKNLKARIRFENLWNEKYQEIDGYGTSGAAVYLGVLGKL